MKHMKYTKIILAAIMGMLMLTSNAYAYPSYQGDFTTKYPNLGTNLTAKVNNCFICHTNGATGVANATLYGKELRAMGVIANATRFANAESMDADGDGFTNLEEINADTDFNDPASKPPFTLTSSSFSDGGAIPLNLACAADGGNDTSPQISLANLPTGTISVSIIMEDTTTATPAIHWGIFQLPATDPITGNLGFAPIAEGAAKTQAQIESLDPSNASGFGYTTAGKNYLGKVGYAGACSGGAQHTYTITAYALDNITTNVAKYFGVANAGNSAFAGVPYVQVSASPTGAQFETEIANMGYNILAKATLTGGFPNAVPASSAGTGTAASSGGGGGGCMTAWSANTSLPVFMLLLLGGIAAMRRRS
jgi:phosphatidylethanolamine-binding protein (PEBP) family uncharacterized protein